MVVQVGKLQQDINIMKYKIIKTQTLDFDPTDLDIIVGEKFMKEVEGVETAFIKVDSIITEKESNSLAQKLTHHEFPFQVWEGMIIGYDPETREPILDKDKLGVILSQFKLKLAE